MCHNVATQIGLPWRFMPKIIDDAQIYRDVMQLIIEQGYDRATTKQMAKAAGVSEVTLFRKYGSKAQLVGQAMLSLTGQTDFATVARFTGDVTADLLRVVTMYQGLAQQEGRFFYTMLLELPRHPELAEFLDTPFMMISKIGQLLIRYQEENVLKQEHPLHALASLIGPLIALNMLRTAHKEAPIPLPDLNDHVASFLNGHRA